MTVDVTPLFGLRLRTPRLELRREDWRPPCAVEIEGLEPCLPLFGLASAAT